MKTAQEVFDKVVRHLAKQGERAAIDDECQYRYQKAGETLLCAVGCLIPQEKYSPAMEYHPCQDEVVWSALGLPKELQPLLIALQETHDGALPKDWEWQLRRVASIYELTMPEVDWTKCEGR